MKTSLLAYAVLATLLLAVCDLDLYRRDRDQREVLHQLEQNLRLLLALERHQTGATP